MNSYRYRVTVEALSDASGRPLEAARTLSFSVANHDDLLEIVRRIRGKDLGLETELDPNDAAAMAIGLKLFSEVALQHRKDAMFADVREALGRFIKELKARPEAGALHS